MNDNPSICIPRIDYEISKWEISDIINKLFFMLKRLYLWQYWCYNTLKRIKTFNASPERLARVQSLV